MHCFGAEYPKIYENYQITTQICKVYGMLFLNLFQPQGFSVHGYKFRTMEQLVIMDLINMRFTFHTKDNLQECMRLSN